MSYAPSPIAEFGDIQSLAKYLTSEQLVCYDRDVAESVKHTSSFCIRYFLKEKILFVGQRNWRPYPVDGYRYRWFAVYDWNDSPIGWTINPKWANILK